MSHNKQNLFLFISRAHKCSSSVKKKSRVLPRKYGPRILSHWRRFYLLLQYQNISKLSICSQPKFHQFEWFAVKSKNIWLWNDWLSSSSFSVRRRLSVHPVAWISIFQGEVSPKVTPKNISRIIFFTPSSTPVENFEYRYRLSSFLLNLLPRMVLCKFGTY